MDFNSAMRYLINCMRSGGIEHHLTVLQILLDNRYTNSEWEEMFERFDMMYECDCSDLDFESRKSYYRAQAIQNCSQVVELQKLKIKLKKEMNKGVEDGEEGEESD